MDNVNAQFLEVLLDFKGAEHSRPSATWGNSSEVRRWRWLNSSSSQKLPTVVSVNWERSGWCSFVMYVHRYPLNHDCFIIYKFHHFLAKLLSKTGTCRVSLGGGKNMLKSSVSILMVIKNNHIHDIVEKVHAFCITFIMCSQLTPHSTHEKAHSWQALRGALC